VLYIDAAPQDLMKTTMCPCRYTQHCLKHRRCKDAATAWHRHRRSFLSDTRALLEEMSLVGSQQLVAAGEALAWEVAAEQRHQLLEQLRGEKEEQQQVGGCMGGHAALDGGWVQAGGRLGMHAALDGGWI
jgi:hypothetical protein